MKNISPQAWEAVTHKERLWGFPIGMETVTLIYNKKILDGPPPRSLSDLATLNAKIKQAHPGVTAILWDYKSAYYSWGILASAGAYIWARNEGGYDLGNVGVANSGAVEAAFKDSRAGAIGRSPEERLLQRCRRSHESRQARDDDLRALGLVKPDEDRNRLWSCAGPGIQRSPSPNRLSVSVPPTSIGQVRTRISPKNSSKAS